MRCADAHQHVAGLKNGDGRDILVMGSRTLWNDLLLAGLVDEVHVMIGGVALGGGTPTFRPGSKVALKLAGARSMAGTDNLLAVYSAS